MPQQVSKVLSGTDKLYAQVSLEPLSTIAISDDTRQLERHASYRL